MTAALDLVRDAKALAFDFDGTLVDSNAIKWRAFEACFADFPAQREEILAYCLGHHAVPRSDKFRYVYERILRLPYTEAAAGRLHERFDSLTTEQIAVAPEIPGASRFLSWARRHHATALLSSTPHETLLDILDRRGWSDLFAAVRGAPVAKGAWLRAWCERHAFGAAEVMVFGDTAEDAEAAARAGCAFVAVGAEALVGGRHRITDFTELIEAL